MLPMSLPTIQKKLREHGIEVSYITLKRRSQDGTLESARRGRKFDFDEVLRLMESSLSKPAKQHESNVSGEQDQAIHAAMQSVLRQLEALTQAVQKMELAIVGLDAVRKMLMVKDDEARSTLRERLEAAYAQIEALRGGLGGGSALDLARMQANLARIVSMLERAPWLA